MADYSNIVGIDEGFSSALITAKAIGEGLGKIAGESACRDMNDNKNAMVGNL